MNQLLFRLFLFGFVFICSLVRADENFEIEEPSKSISNVIDSCFSKDANWCYEKVFNVIALGDTGVGKSSLLNMLAGIFTFKF